MKVSPASDGNFIVPAAYDMYGVTCDKEDRWKAGRARMARKTGGKLEGPGWHGRQLNSQGEVCKKHRRELDGLDKEYSQTAKERVACGIEAKWTSRGLCEARKLTRCPREKFW